MPEPPIAGDDAPRDGDWSWPFDSVLSALEWWYRPLIEPRTWVALGYLFVGVVWAALMFAAAAAMAALTFGLLFAGIGFLLVVPTFRLLDALATTERMRAGWIGDEIEPRPFAQSSGGLWAPIATRLTDPARWRQVAFFPAYLVAALVLFAVAMFPWTAIVESGFGDAFDGGPVRVRAAVLGLALAGLPPRITVFVAGIARSFVAWFVGPDPEAGLQERVDELAEQRGQILDAVAGERRRIERDLHDGVQQQLVALGIDIGRAAARLDEDPETARRLLGEATEKVHGSIGELRLIGRGLHPAVLSDRGLDAALSSVVAGSPIPIAVEVTAREVLPDDVAATAYYVVSEAVANVLKHADARAASVHVDDEPGGARAIRVTVQDDGRGGARAERGSGLAGMRARVEGVDGRFAVESPPGGPTVVTAVIPIDGRRRDG